MESEVATVTNQGCCDGEDPEFKRISPAELEARRLRVIEGLRAKGSMLAPGLPGGGLAQATRGLGAGVVTGLAGGTNLPPIPAVPPARRAYEAAQRFVARGRPDPQEAGDSPHTAAVRLLARCVGPVLRNLVRAGYHLRPELGHHGPTRKLVVADCASRMLEIILGTIPVDCPHKPHIVVAATMEFLTYDCVANRATYDWFRPGKAEHFPREVAERTLLAIEYLDIQAILESAGPEAPQAT